MKLILALSAVLLTSCFDNTPSEAIYDDRDSLEIMFTKDVNSALSEDDFLVYVQALRFTFKNIGKGSNLEWSGPEDTFSGRISVIDIVSVDQNECKDFKQTMTHKGVTYRGLSRSCKFGPTWKIFKINQ